MAPRTKTRQEPGARSQARNDRFAGQELLAEALQTSCGRMLSVGRSGDSDLSLERELRDLLGVPVTLRDERNLNAFCQDPVDRMLTALEKPRKG